MHTLLVMTDSRLAQHFDWSQAEQIVTGASLDLAAQAILRARRAADALLEDARAQAEEIVATARREAAEVLSRACSYLTAVDRVGTPPVLDQAPSDRPAWWVHPQRTDDDDFFIELRQALTDKIPLGPRDDAPLARHREWRPTE
jgi:hypothetical protein